MDCQTSPESTDYASQRIVHCGCIVSRKHRYSSSSSSSSSASSLCSIDILDVEFSIKRRRWTNGGNVRDDLCISGEYHLSSSKKSGTTVGLRNDRALPFPASRNPICPQGSFSIRKLQIAKEKEIRIHCSRDVQSSQSSIISNNNNNNERAHVQVGTIVDAYSTTSNMS